jgi:hypothetical protein
MIYYAKILVPLFQFPVNTILSGNLHNRYSVMARTHRTQSNATNTSWITANKEPAAEREITRDYQLEMLELSKKGNVIIAVCFALSWLGKL